MKTIQMTVDALVANLANTSEAKLTDVALVALKSGDIIHVSVEDPLKGVVLQVDRDGQKIWSRDQSIEAVIDAISNY